MNVVVINYKGGNVLSVINALHRIGVEATLSNDIETIKKADKVIFPGQSEALMTMNFLKEFKLDQVLQTLTQPFLGICIGLQILGARSEEKNTACLDILEGEVVKNFFLEDGSRLKIPHMGWNNVSHSKSELFQNIPDNSYFYFVHSFYMPVNRYTIAETDYINCFSAAIKKDNFYATQFHPEKSGKCGEQLLRNFIEL